MPASRRAVLLSTLLTGLCAVRTVLAAPALPISSDVSFFNSLQSIRALTLKETRAAIAAQAEDRAHILVLKKLEGSGVPDSFVRSVFSDPGVKIEPEVVRRWNRTAEALSYERYRRIFITPERIQAGRRFYADNKEIVDRAARHFQVDPHILVSLVGVETYFGRYRGQFTVFNALYTTIHKVPRRESFAVRELAEFIKYAFNDGITTHAIMGSYAGAFGFGQFIPSSFNHYAVDFDGDGVRDPYHWPDALGSVANYLRKNGYKPHESDFSRGGSVWRGLYAYNHSENYVKVVLELRREILKEEPALSHPQMVVFFAGKLPSP